MAATLLSGWLMTSKIRGLWPSRLLFPGMQENMNMYNMQKEIIRTVEDISNFLTYLTTFTLPGYENNHRVLVFPVRGESHVYTPQ